jgi:hypothetical protein
MCRMDHALTLECISRSANRFRIWTPANSRATMTTAPIIRRTVNRTRGTRMAGHRGENDGRRLYHITCAED